MKRMLQPSNLNTYFKGLAITGLVIVSGLTVPVLAQGRLGFRPTSTGAPGNRESGANRGACVAGNQKLVALMPANNLAQTATSHPALYAYFPGSSAQFAEFALYEAGSNELIYGTLFNVTGEAGLVTIDVPDTATVSPLRIGQRYDWQLKLICDVSDPAGDMRVEGSFERVDSGNVNQQLQGVPVEQQPFIYAEAGLWPETIASLIKASEVNRTTAEQNLKDLLDSDPIELTTQLPSGPLLP
ncbi:MAG: DUF928 domain-containing protein [Leptolyngbyaceae cyanobacterium MAG.088]|nr:DUF928 domain-containing protein [Leptolyngbyaceae cyanobacterium MAG.088]